MGESIGNGQLRRRTSYNNSVLVATLPTKHFDIFDVAVDGNFAYFSNIRGIIYRLNLSNPSAGFSTFASNLGSIAGIAVKGNYIYYIDSRNNRISRLNKQTGTSAGTLTNILSASYLDVKDNKIYTINSKRVVAYTDNLLPLPCDVPKSVTSTPQGQNSFEISWAGGSSSTSYEVVVTETGQSLGDGTSYTTTTTSQVITNLVVGKTYNVYVRANCNTTSTSYSNAIQITLPRSPGTLYVDASATGIDNGSSWANAYTSLSNALNHAVSGDEIWIAKGTYKPSTSSRYSSFNILITNLKIYGGFAGTETSLSNRDVTKIHTTNETILSGDINGNDTPITDASSLNLRADNSYHIVTISNVSNILLNGLTISGGAATSSSGSGRFGAAINASGVDDFTLSNCIVKDNIAVWAAGLSYSPNSSGSGSGASTLTIDACQFNNNQVDVCAAGLYALSTNNLKVQMTNSVFHNNKVKNGGFGAGAALFRNYATGKTLEPIIVNNTFVNNVNGGNYSTTSDYATLGISRNNNGTIANDVVANNIFWGNRDAQGNTSIAIGKVNDVATIDKVYNSIDENDFSNFTTANKTNTSNTNPNLTTVFALQASSTGAINTGDNTKVPTGITKDFLGNNRINATTVDIGAYEYDASLTTGNFNTIKEVRVFPNPVSNMLTVISNSLDIKGIGIYNVLGKKVASTTQKQIEVGNLANGMYILKIISTEGKIATKKFIKQ